MAAKVLDDCCFRDQAGKPGHVRAEQVLDEAWRGCLMPREGSGLGRGFWLLCVLVGDILTRSFRWLVVLGSVCIEEDSW